MAAVRVDELGDDGDPEQMRRRPGESTDEFDKRRAAEAIRKMNKGIESGEMEAASRRVRGRLKNRPIETPQKRMQRLQADTRRRVREAADKGDHEAGRKMMTIALGALARAARRAEIDAGDLEALLFLHDALSQALAGVPLHRAFCIEVAQKKRGRPRKVAPIIEEALVWSQVADAMNRQIDADGKHDREKAIATVAAELRVSPAKVRAYFQNAGGMRAFWSGRSAKC